jgi:penicillin-binding protein 1C
MQTMRLARQGKRNLVQKCIEIFWAWRAELRYSKKEILQLYASHAPFGGNVVGLSAASWRYFHKTPDQLSWGEAASLAVLPNAPGLVHPGRNRNALLQKRNKLLQLLESRGVIDNTEASLAMQEPLPEDPYPLPDFAPHVIAHQDKAGITLHSTLDIELQQRLTELLQRHSDILSMNGVNNAALMVMETESGEVRAYIGNVSNENKIHQNDVDIITSERSSGSILKPFLYCAAHEDGLITPQGIMEDIPTYIRGYQPLNFSRQYMGMVPADQALSMSLNVPAVRLLQQYGILPFKEKLEAAGITTLHYSPDYYGLPLILGGAEVKLWDLCGAYASMGRILSHVSRYDNRYSKNDLHAPVLFQEEKEVGPRVGTDAVRPNDSELTKESPVWNAGAIWLTFEAMKTLRRPDQEGQWETFQSSRPFAWKTGTSFGFRDAWAVGVTPKYTIGVWVGNADGEGRPGVIGLYAAAPVLFDVLRMLDDDLPWWDEPYDELIPKIVCKESGWLAGSGCTQLDTAYIVKGNQVPAVCHFHSSYYVDKSQEYRFDPDCVNEAETLINYFVVPAIAENYYKRYNPSYKSVPPLHPDCISGQHSKQDLAIIYPRMGSKIYVPYEWDHKHSMAVFTAVHRSDNAYVYWTLDKHYLGKTKEFNQIEVDPTPGIHQLVLQDEYGSVATTSFEVLSRK